MIDFVNTAYLPNARIDADWLMLLVQELDCLLRAVDEEATPVFCLEELHKRL